MTAGDWLALKVMVAGLLAGGLVVLSVILRGSLSITLIAGLVGIGVGYVAPEWWLSSRMRDRQKRIEKALPDTLDLLSISVRAGLGFDAALQQSVQSTPGPLSMEFDRALAEIRMGKQRREAMRAIVPRTEVKPLTNFIGAILQAEQLGVPIARVLQIQSEQLRTGAASAGRGQCRQSADQDADPAGGLHSARAVRRHSGSRDHPDLDVSAILSGQSSNAATE